VHKIPLKVQCTLFFCLTSSDYTNAVRDDGAAAEVRFGRFMIKQFQPVSVHFSSSFILLVRYIINRLSENWERIESLHFVHFRYIGWYAWRIFKFITQRTDHYFLVQ